MAKAKQDLSLERAIATFFGIGKIPTASGTFASAAAILLAVLVISVSAPHIIVSMLVTTLVISALAFYSVGEIVDENSFDDPSEIVIDEVLGVFVAILTTAVVIWFATWVSPSGFIFERNAPVGTMIIVFAIILFLSFRFFDISKIGPVGWAEDNFKGATGIILDDVVAGALSGLVTGILAVLVVVLF